MWICIFLVRTWRIFWYQSYLGLLKLFVFTLSAPPFSSGWAIACSLLKVYNKKKIYFYSVNTKYTSSRELKTSEFSLVLHTRENSDVFNTLDGIHLVFTSKSKYPLFIRSWCKNAFNTRSKCYIENIRWESFDIRFTRQGFENACWHCQACQAIQHAFSKPSLVRRKPGILFNSLPSWFTIQTRKYDVIIDFVSIQRHLRRHTKSITSSWPDKGTCREIDNVYQTKCNFAVNLDHGNW